MNFEEDSVAGGVPEWVVTFGDMMSLLLTFFIMLVSLSEIKEEEKYQAMVESIRRQFGYMAASVSVMPGDSKPRNSQVAKLATLGRAKRKDTMRGGAKVEAPVGQDQRVQIVRPGTTTAVGTVIYFDEGSDALSPAGAAALQRQGWIFRGKPQKIEIRGHTSRNPIEATNADGDYWELAYRRCQSAKQYLVGQMGIDPRRIRMSVAGPHEPIHIGTDPVKMKENPRVEVFELDEVVDDRMGTADERKRQFTNA